MEYKKIKFLAGKVGISIAQLSSELGMDSNSFRKSIESGAFSIRNVIPLCKLLKCSPNDVFDYSSVDSFSDIMLQNGGVNNTQTKNTDYSAILRQLEEKDRQLEEKDKQINKLLDLLKK